MSRRKSSVPPAPNAWLGWLAWAWQKLGAITVVAGALWYTLHYDLGAATLATTQLTEQVKALVSGSEATWQLVGVTQRVCLNTARTDEDRIACVSVQGRGR